MSIIKTVEEITLLREAGRRLAAVLDQVEQAVVPGVTADELNDLSEKLIREGGNLPSFLHYWPEGAVEPYPATLCISVNDEVVHGIPTGRVIKDGDLVSIDLGLQYQGYHADMARTVMVGNVSEEAQKLVSTTKQALDAAIAAAQPENFVGDIGAAVEQVVKGSGFHIVKELGGHGIGTSVHEDPFIPNVGKPGSGLQLQSGMVLALEPILVAGSGKIELDPDGYTFKTADNTLAAHFEHTIVVTSKGPEVFTRAS